MDITMTDKIAAIRNKRNELDAKRRREEYVAATRENFLIAKIKEYSQDFGDLVRLANELQDNGFSLNDIKSYWGDRSSFCTDGIHHGVGFFVRDPFWGRRKEIIGFGIENGGAWGNVDLLIDFDGNVITKGEKCSGKWVSMEHFVESFPKFKARFLEYVDKITK